jgi:acetyl-CoA synthetase
MAEKHLLTQTTNEDVSAFLRARDFLLDHRKDYEAAYRGFHWPQLTTFNWALDYFDAYALGNNKLALWIVDDSGAETLITR